MPNSKTVYSSFILLLSIFFNPMICDQVKAESQNMIHFQTMKEVEEALGLHLQETALLRQSNQDDYLNILALFKDCDAIDWVKNAGPLLWNTAMMDGEYPLTGLVSYEFLKQRHPNQKGLYGLKLLSHAKRPGFLLNAIVFTDMEESKSWDIQPADLNKVLLSITDQEVGLAISISLVPQSLLVNWFAEKHYLDASPIVIATALQGLLKDSSIDWSLLEDAGISRIEMHKVLETLALVPGTPQVVAACYLDTNHKHFNSLLQSVISDSTLHKGYQYTVIRLRIDYINSHPEILSKVDDNTKRLVKKANKSLLEQPEKN
ncbi:MAG: hypothetical protein COA78_16775 [Blastopirellula sp.]|nr:MAG: hypothetical protein COA78_16775 [Blastopirellula sp.]